MRKFLLWIAVAIVILLIGFSILNNYIYQQKQGNGAGSEPYQALLSGELVCLPHKDTSGPQTMECAYGLKTETGEYYAVDLGLLSQTPPALEIGTKFSANGLITPVERLSTDHWQRYPIEGIFSVTSDIKMGQ